MSIGFPWGLLEKHMALHVVLGTLMCWSQEAMGKSCTIIMPCTAMKSNLSIVWALFWVANDSPTRKCNSKDDPWYRFWSPSTLIIADEGIFMENKHDGDGKSLWIKFYCPRMYMDSHHGPPDGSVRLHWQSHRPTTYMFRIYLACTQKGVGLNYLSSKKKEGGT